MLQRIQSIFMLLASIVLIVILYLQLESDSLINNIGLLILSFVSFLNIFFFNKRKLQITLNRLICLGILGLLGLSFYESGILSGEKQFSKKDIELALPAISIVFLLIANKYIKRDEALVKSVDRIR